MDWSTILVSVLSFIGTLAGSYSGMKLMTYRIEQLEKKVNEHNNVIRRTYILEEQMKVVNNRVDDLERHEEERENE